MTLTGEMGFIAMIYIKSFLNKVQEDVKRYKSFLTHTFYM